MLITIKIIRIISKVIIIKITNIKIILIIITITIKCKIAI